jgi:hypothetical protein
LSVSSTVIRGVRTNWDVNIGGTNPTDLGRFEGEGEMLQSLGKREKIK